VCVSGRAIVRKSRQGCSVCGRGIVRERVVKGFELRPCVCVERGVVSESGLGYACVWTGTLPILCQSRLFFPHTF